MNLTTSSKYALIAFVVVAVTIIAGCTLLVYSGHMDSSVFSTLAVLILSVFGAAGVVQATGHVIQQTNGYKETTTTTLPSDAPITVTTTKTPPSQT